MTKLGWRQVHEAADALDRRVGERIRSFPRLRRAWIGLLDFLVGRQSDRRYMRRAILPAVAGERPHRVLHAGVRGYTRHYGAFFRAPPTEFWTCDIDPEAARYGAPGRHLIHDVRRLDAAFPPGHFDVVL
ncbi:MAG TPA: hypothetical protein VHF69_08425, partial [Candidatus Synoicihabitans sp.]|nr:hypothetical protein [Candidatus Synoicihabitans sp.]